MIKEEVGFIIKLVLKHNGKTLYAAYKGAYTENLSYAMIYDSEKSLNRALASRGFYTQQYRDQELEILKVRRITEIIK